MLAVLAFRLRQGMPARKMTVGQKNQKPGMEESLNTTQGITMRVLVTGGSGLLGRQLMHAFDDCETIGTALTRSGSRLRRVDLTDRAAVDAFVRDFAPEVIVHSAAERRPDVSEGDPEATEKLNVAATAQLAELASELGAWMLYLSTDYVFDGTAPPYAVTAAAHPLNNYGRSKFAGEEVMRKVLPSGAILRVPILYGPVENLAESAITLIYQALCDGTAPLDHWATRFPTHTQDVAAACRQMVDRQSTHGDVDGTFHFSGAEALTKYEMALIMARATGIDASGLTADTEVPAGAPRPRDCRLDCSRLDALLAPSRRPFEDGVATALAPHLGN